MFLRRFKGKSIFLFLCFYLSGLIFLACTQRTATIEKPAPSEPLKQRTGISSQEPWEIEWKELIEEARKEDRVVLISSWSPPERQAISEAIRSKFGIIVEIISGRGAEIVEKVLREKRAGLHLVDLFIGSSTMAIPLKEQGLAIPFEKFFILPEVKDEKLWYRGRLPWIDKERLIFLYGNHVTGYDIITINTQLVKEGEIKLLKDLLKPKWKGKILMDDPTIPGRGNQILAVWGEKFGGYDYWKELAKQEPLLLRDKRQQAEWIARGKYLVGIGPREEFVTEFAEAGAPIAQPPLRELVYSTGPRSAVVWFKEAPHPSAAKLFLNWLISKEGQILWSKSTKFQSAREDVTVEYVPEEKRRMPGEDYFLTDSEEYLMNRNNHLRLAGEIFGHLLK